MPVPDEAVREASGAASVEGSAVAGFLVIANPVTAGGHRAGVEDAVRRLAGTAPAELRWTADLDELQRALDDVGDRRLVVAGGDGSVHAVVNALGIDRLARTDVALLPLGTGNDLARSLGVPLDTELAADLAATGSAVGYDLLEITGGRLVVNAAHCGVGVAAARAAARRGPGWKNRLGSAVYALAAVSAGLRYRAQHATVEVDGEVLSQGATFFVDVANGATIGGGLPAAPGADPGDAHLTVVVVGDIGRAHRPALALDLLRSRHHTRSDTVLGRGHRVSVLGFDQVDADGEPVDVPGHWRAEVRPGALAVVAPPRVGR